MNLHLPPPMIRKRDLRIGRDAEAAVAVAIPARNEARRIGACLDSLAKAQSGQKLKIVVLVNNTTDDTAAVAEWRCRENGLSARILDVDLPPEMAHAGGARGLALEIAARSLPPEGALLTTDADSRVAPDWITANLAELDRGAALVGGLIEIAPAEVPDFSPEARAALRAEAHYLDLMRRLESLLDPDPWNPWPHHGGMNGASMATRRIFHDRVGGLPRVPVSEDRALLARYRSFDLPVVHSDLPRVQTSGRIVGRAPGGMADAVAARLADADTLIDQWGEPARAWGERLRLRARVRELRAVGASLGPVLRKLGIPSGTGILIEGLPTFGATWSAIEAASRLRDRHRMRPSELLLQSLRLERMILARTGTRSEPQSNAIQMAR